MQVGVVAAQHCPTRSAQERCECIALCSRGAARRFTNDAIRGASEDGQWEDGGRGGVQKFRGGRSSNQQHTDAEGACFGRKHFCARMLSFDVVTSSVSPTDWHILSEELEEPKATSIYRGQGLIPSSPRTLNLFTHRRHIHRSNFSVPPFTTLTRPSQFRRLTQTTNTMPASIFVRDYTTHAREAQQLWRKRQEQQSQKPNALTGNRLRGLDLRDRENYHGSSSLDLARRMSSDSAGSASSSASSSRSSPVSSVA